jgi:hypothetical protein
MLSLKLTYYAFLMQWDHPTYVFKKQRKVKYDKQDQQGKAAFNERHPHMTQQQEPMARSPGGPQTKTGQGKDSSL